MSYLDGLLKITLLSKLVGGGSWTPILILFLVFFGLPFACARIVNTYDMIGSEEVVMQLHKPSKMLIYDVNSKLSFESNNFKKTVGESPYVIAGGLTGIINYRNVIIKIDKDVKDKKEISLVKTSIRGYIPKSCMVPIANILSQRKNILDNWVAKYKTEKVVSFRDDIKTPDLPDINNACENIILKDTTFYTKPCSIDEGGQWAGDCNVKAFVFQTKMEFFGIKTKRVEELEVKIKDLNVTTDISEQNILPTTDVETISVIDDKVTEELILDDSSDNEVQNSINHHKTEVLVGDTSLQDVSPIQENVNLDESLLTDNLVKPTGSVEPPEPKEPESSQFRTSIIPGH